VYSVPDKKEQTHYALDTACKLLEFYNDFFEISYPLKKLGECTEVLACFTQGAHKLLFPPRFTRPNILPFSFLRLGSHPRLPGRSHGELGTHHVQRDQPAGGRTLLESGKTSRGLRRRARARSPGSRVV